MCCKNPGWSVFLAALLLVSSSVLLTAALGAESAEEEGKQEQKDTSKEKKDKPKTKKAAKKEAPTVFTNEDLKKYRVKGESAKEAQPKMDVSGATAGGNVGNQSEVITNENLAERLSEAEAGERKPGLPPNLAPQKPAGNTPVFTNDDLDESPEAEPEAEGPTAEEKAERVTAIDAEITKLKQRMVALTNPLRGGAPLLEEEKGEWKDLGADKRVEKIKEKISNLEKERAELSE